MRPGTRGFALPGLSVLRCKQDENSCPPDPWGQDSRRENRSECAAAISKGQSVTKPRECLKNLSLKENHRGDSTVGQRNRSGQPCAFLGSSASCHIPATAPRAVNAHRFPVHCRFQVRVLPHTNVCGLRFCGVEWTEVPCLCLSEGHGDRGRTCAQSGGPARSPHHNAVCGVGSRVLP